MFTNYFNNNSKRIKTSISSFPYQLLLLYPNCMTRKAGSWACEAAAHRSCSQETAQTGGGSLALKPEGLSLGNHFLQPVPPPEGSTPSPNNNTKLGNKCSNSGAGGGYFSFKSQFPNWKRAIQGKIWIFIQVMTLQHNQARCKQVRLAVRRHTEFNLRNLSV